VSTPLRIGVDGRELEAGTRTGIGRWVVRVVQAAAARGLECVVYGDRTSALPRFSGVVRPVQLHGAWTPWWDQVVLPRALARDAVDVFLSPYYKGPLSAPCPVVITIHDLYFIAYPGRPRPLRDAALTALARLYARRASAVITVSEASRRDIVARLGLSPARIAVIPSGLGSDFATAALRPEHRERYGLGARYVLYVGNFMPHKNLPRLLQAWAMLPADVRATHRLVLAGGDETGRQGLQVLARSLGIDAGVVFPGFVADADLPALYGGAAAFVLPSLDEGFGLTTVEAMACGAPVIASRRGALPEVVGDAGVLVDPENVALLASALTRVLRSDDERAALARRGPVQAARFTAERTAVPVVDLLETVAGSRPALAGRAG
jgi:glycosyltransferase involved in cell wall biosynthesis